MSPSKQLPCNAGACPAQARSWQPQQLLPAAARSMPQLPVLQVRRASCAQPGPRSLSCSGQQRRCRRHRRQRHVPGPASLAAHRLLVQRLPQLSQSRPHPSRQPQQAVNRRLPSPSVQRQEGLRVLTPPRLQRSSSGSSKRGQQQHLVQGRRQLRLAPRRTRRNLLQPSHLSSQLPARLPSRSDTLRNALCQHAAAQLSLSLAHRNSRPLLRRPHRPQSARQLATTCLHLEALLRRCQDRRRGRPRRAPA